MSVSKESFEHLLDEFHKEKFEFLSDTLDEKVRIVRLKKHTVYVNLFHSHIISYDAYAELSAGIYELGELHVLTRRMLNVKKICQAYEAREMNTTERLYPANRRGENTSTSGL
ncbi:MAG: hypothetical protein INQ03_09545 [Candidatus Heimdallarchaeota archaeon]|nr:hypothetical protein [Candidatus Heimdallarchaeota archaeon]